MSISTEAAAIDGKTFQFGSGVSFARGELSTGTAQVIDGQTVYSGYVLPDANHGYSGTETITVLDLVTGTLQITQTDLDYNIGTYVSQGQILGADPTGQFLVIGSSDGTPSLFLHAQPFDPNSIAPTVFSFDSRNDFNFAQLDGVVPCFSAGTLIRTPRGDVAVEDLATGETVLTASGEEVAIQWIGHHTVRCDRCFDPTVAWPIRISAEALGEGKPDRDLFVSPGHAIWVPFMDDGALIPAAALVNGGTIAQVEVEKVTYWHVELPDHDILLANALPAESYVDVGNRSFFTSSDSHIAPDGPSRTTAEYCRPFFADGPVVQAVRQAVKSRALALGWTLDAVVEPTMHIVADDVVVHPAFDGQKARFILPADANDVWLVSETSVPYQVMDIPDHRRLGVRLDALSISDGLGVHRQVALDDRMLCTGFHRIEEDGTRRWTAKRARLPAKLWEGCRDIVIVQIGFLAPLLPRWTPPSNSGVGLSPSCAETHVARSSASAA